MTVVARRFVATPERAATETWQAITSMICQSDETARQEFGSINGAAASSIVEEAFRAHPFVMRGNGPRLRVYCLYGDDSISGEDKNEDALSWQPTQGSWKAHLPCASEDFAWIDKELRAKTEHFVAYDITQDIPDENEESAEKSVAESNGFSINAERFKNL